MIGLTEYALIKNNYCLCYFGAANEYLVQLRLLRPFLQKRFPGLNLYLSCKDESMAFLENEDRVVPLSRLKIERPSFAHVRELVFNGKDHPVEMLLKESGIAEYQVPIPKTPDCTNGCAVIVHGSFPTVSLNLEQIQFAKRYARNFGWTPILDKDSCET